MIETIKNEIDILNNQLENPSSPLTKTEISNIKKEIKNKKLLLKEKEKELTETLLSVKNFFSYIASNCAFESVMEDVLNTEDKTKSKFLIYPNNDNIIIMPFDVSDVFMLSFIKIKITEEITSNFVNWIISSNNPIIFTLSDYNMFRKISTTPGKKGVKLVINSVNESNDKFMTSGCFYIDGNQDIEWEHEFTKDMSKTELCTEYLNILDDNNFNTQLKFDSSNNLRHIEDDETIVEMSSDMVRIWQKSESVYKLYIYDSNDMGFTGVVIASFNSPNTFSIYQKMNVIKFY